MLSRVPPHPLGFRARVALALAPALTLALAACGGDAPTSRDVTVRPRPTSRPSVVLVNVSGARHDAVVASNGAAPLLPAFAAFAKDATWFDQATAAAAWETPSLTTALTGLIPYDTNMGGRAGDARPYLIPSILTLAEMLRDECYATAAIVSGPNVTKPLGLDQGFDGWRDGLATDAVPAAAETWLASRETNRPFFLFVHLDATRPPPPEGTTDLSAWAGPAYEARIREADAALARVTKALDAASLPADTMTILFSDHGEPRAIPPSGVLRGDGVTDDAVRVPLAVRAPSWPKARVAGSCGLVDLVPTVRDAMGLPPASGTGGRTLVPLARAPTAPGAPILVQAWRLTATAKGPVETTVFAVRTARAKFVADFTRRPPAWTETFYDLERDPEERAPLSGDAAASFGPDFEKAVQNVRLLLQGRRKHFNDPVIVGYAAGGG
jgi:arylsulfatase A-like enzyme